MNDTLDTTFETDFNTAMKMSENEYDYQALIQFLSSDKIVEKQIATLKLTEIKSKEDAQLLVSNLIGQDGKIREAVAFKINELAQNCQYWTFFNDGKIFDILLQGIMDINGNVCRQIVGSQLIKNTEFGTYLCNKLPEKISWIMDEIEKIDLQSKQYVISKRNFQLYWCLEALFNIINSIDFELIKDILLKTGEFYDYTIREKTAKILNKIDNPKLAGLKEKLKNDDNYYVRIWLNRGMKG